MRHAGEVVTKTDILRAVWDAHYEGEVTSWRSTSATCAARSTRRSGCGSIETLRGMGYRMVEPG